MVLTGGHIESPKSIVQNLIKNGKEYFSNASHEYRGGLYGSQTCTAYTGFWSSFRQALEEVGNKGIIASMPLLIAAKSMADQDNYLWNPHGESNGFNTFSTDCVVCDLSGKFRRKDDYILVTVHSGFIPTYYALDSPTDSDLSDLLEGILPNGDEVPVYSVEDVRETRIHDPFGKYIVWSDLKKGCSSEYKDKSTFMNDDQVLARAGSLEYLERYFDKAKGIQGIYEDKLGLDDLHERSYMPRGHINSLFLHSDFEGIRHFNGLTQKFGNFIGARLS